VEITFFVTADQRLNLVRIVRGEDAMTFEAGLEINMAA
jgi:hypothetical protein